MLIFGQPSASAHLGVIYFYQLTDRHYIFMAHRIATRFCLHIPGGFRHNVNIVDDLIIFPLLA
jgi:hypothetical protein